MDRERADAAIDPRGLELRFRGVRGSISHPASDRLAYGAHTTCAEVRLPDESLLLIDAGSGLLSVPVDPRDREREILILLTHYHRDHVEGLPFFPPLYDAGQRLAFYGPVLGGCGPREALEGAFRPPWFPVPFAEAASAKRYLEISLAEAGRLERWTIGGLAVTAALVNHRHGAIAWRLEHAGGALVFATDTEFGDPRFDAALIELSRGAAVLVHDAQHTPEELDRGVPPHGHSSWRQAVTVAREAGVGRLILFHHHPFRTDAEVDAIVQAARREFPDVEAAREGGSVVF